MMIPPAYSFICTVAHGPAKPGNQLLPGTCGAQGLALGPSFLHSSRHRVTAREVRSCYISTSTQF